METEHGAPLRGLAELAERSAKRTRLVYARTVLKTPGVESDPALRAYFSTKIAREYGDVQILPDVIRAQQGATATPRSKAKDTGASMEMAHVLDTLESERGIGPTAAPSASDGTVSVRAAFAAKPRSESQLESALIGTSDANHAADGQSMLSRALQRKKELARREAQPTPHPQWKLMRVISGHLGWVRCMAVEPNNQWFATGAGDRMIKLWDMASGQLKLSLTGHISTVRGLAISARHPYMFSAGEDKLVKCWDLETNKVVRQYYGHLSGIYALGLHPTLDVVVTAGRDACARVWDIRTKAQVHVLSGHRGTVASVLCQEAEPQVITGSMDATVKLWDLASGRCTNTLTQHKKSVRALALAPHEYTFASGSAGGRNIKRWRCPEGTLLNNMTNEGIVNTLAVNPDGVLFSGTDTGSIRFFDYDTGVPFQSIEDIVQPGSLDAEAGVFCSTFDQTGTRLLTGGADKTIKVYREV
ncbi:pre-mRNA-splicing factor prp46 [Malassezia vespertilionis]|uniref:Pre-mRNA-splicing factor PRP46 n=1 Tax=Malassezia vespertilionis TaxID=2020962 RepID=A0A2N1JA25_9BASI|nr:pre-mRNA-splicing factor prp46 [Malassezia vespertilionis]PKI83409.1 Prp46p [Malassezia vespertilionis]WFD07482.1 pre-mRNA-splicing factor prp46 [Malassezia vespertilionis]